LSESRIIANQSKLTRALRFSGCDIKLYVRDESHHSGMGTRELASKLSEGFAYQYRGRVIDVPARPFIKQFMAENKEEIERFVIASQAWLDKDPGKWNEVAESILELFRFWLLNGGVTPANKASTVAKKGSSAPLADHAARSIDADTLLYAIVTEAQIVTPK